MTHGWAYGYSRICNYLNKKQVKCYGPGKLFFGRDMILPIKTKVDW